MSAARVDTVEVEPREGGELRLTVHIGAAPLAFIVTREVSCKLIAALMVELSPSKDEMGTAYREALAP